MTTSHHARAVVTGAGCTTLAETLMRATGVSPDKIAVDTLNKYDRGRLYVVPQIDAKVIWRLKRIAPALYTRALGLLAPHDNELTGV